MATNLSKYVQLNDFLLLEYEFNNDQVETDLTGITSVVAKNILGFNQYFNSSNAIGVTNNTLSLNSLPLDSKKTRWYINPDDTSAYWARFDSSTSISGNYQMDEVRVHIVSGYNFDDIAGFLLQISAEASDGSYANLSNFTWINQVLGGGVIRFSSNALLLGNRFYDKYIQLRIPSVRQLGSDSLSPIGQALGIEQNSDVFISYSTIADIEVDEYMLSDLISVQLPISSLADSFNCFIAESTIGDFIEFYATWNDIIIGESMGDIESGRIKLFTSNSNNFQDFADTYGAGAPKWVLMHEIQVFEHIPGGTSLLTQKYVFTQEDGFNSPNYFRPIIRNSDIVSSFSIIYICRLMNRMDGTQIIRRASFSSTNPKKYGFRFNRINVDNYIPYRIFNRIEGEASQPMIPVGAPQNRFVRVYYETTGVVLNQDNEVFPQGTGPLFIKNGTGVYVFKFERISRNSERENADLSGIFNYILLFMLDSGDRIEIAYTPSQNTNTVRGELEFTISDSQSEILRAQKRNSYSIVVQNPDRSKYTFYEGLYYSYSDKDEVIEEFNGSLNENQLQQRITSLEDQVSRLQEENALLRTSQGTASPTTSPTATTDQAAEELPPSLKGRVKSLRKRGLIEGPDRLQPL